MWTIEPVRESTRQFFEAIERSDTEMLRSMVAAGFDIRSAELEAREGAIEHAVEYHVIYEDDPQTKDADPRPVIEVLLDLGADINAFVDETNALLYAVWNCNVELADWLIRRGADVNHIYCDADGRFRETVLDYAYIDKLLSESNPHTKYAPPEQYQRLIAMLESQGAKLAQDLDCGSS